MLQRIQTLYLALFCCIAASFHFVPLGNIFVDNKEILPYTIYNIGVWGITNYLFSTLPMAILNALIILTGLVSIFLFAKRKLQLKMVLATGVLLIIFTLFVFFGPGLLIPLEWEITNYNFIVYLPAVQFVLIYLAYKGIKKDEELVKSVDRIR